LGENDSYIFSENQIKFGKGIRINDGKDITIIVTGPQLDNVLKAKKELERQNILPEIIYIHTIKPLDEKAIISAVKKSGCVVTVEEHQIAGGLGGAISEVLAREFPAPIEFIGLNDSFGESGNPKELIMCYE